MEENNHIQISTHTPTTINKNVPSEKYTIISIDCGIKNLSICSMELDNEKTIQDIPLWRTIDILNGKQIKSYTQFKIIEKLIKKLDEISFPDNIKYILIENQPNINKKMNVIQLSLVNYFITRYVLDKKQKNIQIKYISPKLKLYNTIKSHAYTEFNNTSKNTPYIKRKKGSVILTDEIINTKFSSNLQTSQNVKNYLSEKKKDDYADCFMQCYNFLHYN